jgi:hypothetical protein
MAGDMITFIPITKVDRARHEIYGWGAVEEADNADEIMDYASSKPHFQEWSSKAQKRSCGKSLGNLRSMHSNKVAGKIIDMRPDDVRKGFWLGAKIVDEQEWEKCEQGVYTGFSVGGSYLKRWADYQNPGKIRYTAKPTEMSIVDSPCIPSATFQLVKADGAIEDVPFKPGLGENEMVAEDEVAERMLAEDDLNPDENQEMDVEKVLQALEVLKMELSKAIPGAPEGITDIPLKSEVGPSFEAEQMPAPNAIMELPQTGDVSQESLMAHAVKSQDLSAEFEAWLPKVGAVVTKAIEDAMGKSSPAGRMIAVKHGNKLIKVVKEK